MKALPHRYEVTVASGPGSYASIESRALPAIRSAPPVEFDGPGDGWSPEQLLVGAVASCFLLTLRVVAQTSRVDLSVLAVEGEGVVDRVNGSTRFTEIVLRPRLTLRPGVDRAQVDRTLERAKRACLVSASLAAPVRVEPEIAG